MNDTWMINTWVWKWMMNWSFHGVVIIRRLVCLTVTIPWPSSLNPEPWPMKPCSLFPFPCYAAHHKHECVRAETSGGHFPRLLLAATSTAQWLKMKRGPRCAALYSSGICIVYALFVPHFGCIVCRDIRAILPRTLTPLTPVIFLGGYTWQGIYRIPIGIGNA